MNQQETKKTLLGNNHRACAGCSQIMAARIVIDTLGPNTIISNATGCLEVVSTATPNSAWGVPWIHSLFANPASVASGILAGLKALKKDKDTTVVVQAGDGSTFDIGFGAISGLWTRNEKIIYICYDNEAYANTGSQSSGATPKNARTTTAPSGLNAIGDQSHKKDMTAIAVAYGLSYVAQTTIGYPEDLKEKIEKAKLATGSSYIQILVPCIPGWQISIADSIKLAKLAVETGFYPSLEYIDGNLTKVIKAPKNKPKIEEYLKPQGRFAHLFKSETGKAAIQEMQDLADNNIKKYSL